MKSARRKIVFVLTVALAVVGCPAVWASQDTYRQAYDSGYSRGTESGRSDRTASQPFDFANKIEYQQALDGYDPQFNDRDVYVVAFRRGFEDGYEVGYGLGKEKSSNPPPSDNNFSLSSSAGDYPRGGRAVLLRGTLIHVRLLETLSTQRNERGDDFRAEVLNDVDIDGDVVIPAGSRLYGLITHLKRAGRIKGRAEMNLKFTEVELRDGMTLDMAATVSSIEERADDEVKDEEGTIQGPGGKGQDAKKVAKTTGLGALLGVLTGGGKGAKVGAAVGAVAGLAGVIATRGRDMVLPSETELVIKLDEDLEVPTGLLRP